MACTTFLVGKKASLDGSTLIARNEDGGDKPNPQRFVVINPENQPKRYRSIATACEFDLPDNPYHIPLLPMLPLLTAFGLQLELIVRMLP